jgi:uncharacterized protein HemX
LAKATLKERYLALPHTTHVLIYLGIGIVAFGLLMWGTGKAKDAWELHQYNKTRAADTKKAQEEEQLAQQAVGQAKAKEAEADQWKAKAAELEQQRDLALQALADSSKTAQQKRQAYEEIRNRPTPVVVTVDNSVDELCQRAAAINPGLKCEPK